MFGLDISHEYAEVNGVRLHYVTGGAKDGETLVLLHGFPQSWAMWRRVWPALAARYRLVAVDLRGYGDAEKPAGEAGYDKGTMAADVQALARHLGLGKFLLVGHDRGARVARRYALDYPDDLAGVALLDILPVEYVYDTYTAAEIAAKYWHWVFQIVPELPEQLIAGHEETYLERFFQRTPGLLDQMRADGAWDEYRRCFLQPGAVAAQLNDYRATYHVDVPHYRARNAVGAKIMVPTLLLWGERGNLAERPALAIWRTVADEVRGEPIPDCGHYLPEEQPVIVADRLMAFAAERFAAP